VGSRRIFTIIGRHLADTTAGGILPRSRPGEVGRPQLSYPEMPSHAARRTRGSGWRSASTMALTEVSSALSASLRAAHVRTIGLAWRIIVAQKAGGASPLPRRIAWISCGSVGSAPKPSQSSVRRNARSAGRPHGWAGTGAATLNFVRGAPVIRSVLRGAV
jgi:hypothetical protein